MPLQLPDRARMFLPILTVVLMLGGGGCGHVYIPNESALQPMSPTKARRIVSKTLIDSHVVYVKGVWRDDSGNSDIKEVKVVGNIDLVFVLKGGKSVSFPLKDINMKIYEYSSIIINEKSRLGDSIKPDRAKQFVDAIYVLKARASDEGVKQDAANFEKVVQSYRNSSTKPTLSEDVRRYKVQAEGEIRDKKYEDAADLYEEALNIAPWWPEGHYNRALVLAEVGEFDLAIQEMKRYILLEPDAPNARAARDKIYLWERKVEKQK